MQVKKLTIIILRARHSRSLSRDFKTPLSGIVICGIGCSLPPITNISILAHSYAKQKVNSRNTNFLPEYQEPKWSSPNARDCRQPANEFPISQ
ncbi:hypothetical protein TNIN_320831 [Trichonephila inaurata madagascariensis]|uniref:Uncharacterized protein n=1 Tax=Trichonephila inaurata madagascariensis TaxID=2747483 RepID=A0A8X6M857_9ARAC|nr:hypothetical protein TNIN_320831 [Trichonephila inaurata madagascariensis]